MTDSDARLCSCPNGCDLRDRPIPEEMRERAQGRTHTSRRIALCERRDSYVRAWLCPDCGVIWPR